MAVSLASAAGARVVVTSASDAKIDAARDLGASEGVDHGQDGWTGRARTMTPRGEGLDLIVDSVGRWAESIACLRPGGRCVVLGASAGERAVIDVRPFYFGQYELIGTTRTLPACSPSWPTRRAAARHRPGLPAQRSGGRPREAGVRGRLRQDRLGTPLTWNRRRAAPRGIPEEEEPAWQRT